MLRLLQGDVGAGKTMVALMALLRGVEAGMQSAMLAPTEILARQHYASLQKLLSGLPINIAILTGREKGSLREATLMGLAENPGELAGYGPIPASVAREFAADARWKRFVTDPLTGNLLDFGREHYEPPQALKDFLIARDRTCRFPGCRRSAILADLDHAESWRSGGETSPENLGALCRRHHKMKTHHGWRLESFADGSCIWRSPFGKEFFTPARPAHEPV